MASEVGLIGLAVMGQNLALNMAGKGIKVAVHNRTVETARKFMEERAKGQPIEHGEKLEDFVALLSEPRIVMIMVKAGEPVDEMLSRLAPLLSSEDLVLDLGNSHFKDTERRAKELDDKSIEYMGVGVSGGEQGALDGPSIMPGGSKEAYVRVKDIFEKIAAKTEDGPCVTHVGPADAGHFVKMVHNGLEYGDMQLIAETYDVLRRIGFMSAKDIAEAFEGYNSIELRSYLIEITTRILKEKDEDTGKPILDVIMDKVGQKGTGTWTVQAALELGVPIPTITAAVEARSLSAYKDLRIEAEKAIKTVKPKQPPRTPRDYLVRAAGAAMYAARISLYAQGIGLLEAASKEYGYDLDILEIARIWKGGCIIRSDLLDVIRQAYSENPGLKSLLMDPEVIEVIDQCYDNWGNVQRFAIAYGIPCPALSSSLAFFDGIRTSRLPANLIQAQRDFFGAHMFERLDKEGTFHHQWKKKK